MMNKSFYFLITFLLSFNLLAQDDLNKETPLKEVDVIVGLEKIIQLDFIPNDIVKIANESLVSYQNARAKKQILLVGLKPGETTMTLRDTAGEIKSRYLLKVVQSDNSKVILQLKDLLSDVEGLEIGMKGDSVYVGGMIVVPSDIGKVVVILEKFPDVLRLVELSPQTQIVIAKKMQDEIQRSSFKDVTVRVVNGSFWIEGVVAAEAESARVEQIVKAYLPDQIQNLARRTDSVQSLKKPPYEILLTINTKPKPEPIPKLFKITAQFVELTKNYNRVFGFSWAPNIGPDGGQISIGRGSTGGLTTSSNGVLSATIGNLFPKLNSAKNAGYARVMESGVILVKERTPGKLNKVTTIPFAVGTGDTTKASESKSGFIMSVTPTMLQEEKINLKIVVTVSSAVGTSPPTTLENTVDTEVVVKSQESAVLGGVVSNKTGTNYDKPFTNAPTITQGSTLFSFLKAKEYTTDRSQFVIFLTPEIIETASSGTSEVERKFRKKGR